MQLLKALSKYVTMATSLVACQQATDAPQTTTPTKETKNPTPNIIVILADDLGYSDLGCYGSEIQTPNLDKLAQNGQRFTNFYNSARCCPTRASLLTGLYPHQAGIGGMVGGKGPGPYQGYLNDSCQTIAEVLKTAGYSTYMSGKWHVGEEAPHWPQKRGFDKYFGLISGASSYFEIITDQPRVRKMVKDDTLWTPPDSGFYATDAYTNYAVNLIKQHSQTSTDKPFFLYLAYTAPHWPLHALPQDIAKYKGVYDIGWDSLRTLRYQKQQQLGITVPGYALSDRNVDANAWPNANDKQRWIDRMQVYAAMVDRMDQGIGEVVDALKQNNYFDNTLIVFLSDNGACAETVESRGLDNPNVPVGAKGSYVAYDAEWANASNTPYRWFKKYTHEGGIKTPFIAHWPNGITQTGGFNQSLGHITDLLPTFIELSGAEYNPTQTIKPLPGKSMLPAFGSPNATYRNHVYWEHEGNRAVRAGHWKAVYHKRYKTWELYNLEKDPVELNNLATDQPQKLQEMVAKWQAWAKDVGV